jgi:hypothetical protein
MTIPGDSGSQELEGTRRPTGAEQFSDRIVDARRSAAPAEAPPITIYDAIRELLVERGWSQGCEQHAPGSRLCLRAAIDESVASTTAGGASGPALARAARVQRHLRELAPTSNLDHWNDSPERTVSDVLELLSLAALAFSDD